MMLALAVEIVYVLMASPRMAVRRIEVRGDAQVAKQVAGQISLPGDTSFLRAPTERLLKQVQGVTSVRRARVARRFPGRLVVLVERREATAVVRRDDRAVLVDPQGTLYTIPGEWAWGLPELVGPHLTRGEMQGVEGKSEIRTLLSAARALGADPRLRVVRLEMESGGEVTAVLDSGARVRLGGDDRMETKAKLLANVIEHMGSNRIASVDLSDPEAAFWRPKSTETQLTAR
jgi:cell division septal protein FtsQ